MENREPNQIVSKLNKEFKRIYDSEVQATEQSYKDIEVLKNKLQDITRCVGAIEVMSKNSILKLIKMQSSVRFMNEHTFYIQFAKAYKDLNL